jgi:RimJ/RimL family protein N-acetyltransferase
MEPVHPTLIDLPMPIRTPRLLIRPKQSGDGAIASPAIEETWEDLHQWMRWAEDRSAFTVEAMETRNRQVMARFLLREEIELIGIESATGQSVVWTGLHAIDWQARQCDIGYWVRKSAHGRGIATETANALVRYAFGALGMQRVGLTHSAGNEPSRRIAATLGFSFEAIQPAANPLPGGRSADKLCYARLDTSHLPPLDVHWGPDS